MSTPRWHKRKLISADGERMLWHALEHLSGIIHDVDPSKLAAIETIRQLLRQF